MGERRRTYGMADQTRRRSMSDKRVIAVVGATGAQGGGLARAILADPDSGFAVRALTRDPSKEQAQALAAAGAEVVQADISDEASIRAAFEGAYGAFCVTNFWETFSAETELEQAGNMARAAKAAGIQHAIWSTLEDTRTFIPLDDDRMPTLQERFKVPHFDAKEESNRFFTDAGVPTTFLYTAFYWENFIFFGVEPKRGEDGRLALTFPLGSAKMPAMAAEDIGKVAYAIFRAGSEYIGASVYIAGEHLSGSELAAAFTDALGEEVVYNEVEPDVYRNFGFPGADELGNMFQFKRDFESEYVGHRDLDKARALHPELLDFRTWLAQNASRIPIS
jgi:uncharacterized protein YbjT (DUF2867 family)